MLNSLTRNEQMIAAGDQNLSVLDRARMAAPTIRALGKACEDKGQLTDEMLNTLGSAGLFKFWLPKCFGGDETPPTEAIELIEILCHADASAAWVAMAVNGCTAAAAAYLPVPTAQALFANRTTLIAGQGAPVGRAVVEKGGYRLTGKWQYGSGTLHADYVHTGSLVQPSGEVKICIVPVEAVEFLGNWDTLGLRATGSVDYAVDHVFVPEEFTHDVIVSAPNHGGDLYRIGLAGLSATAHSAFALGMARRALEELSSIAVERPTSYMAGSNTTTFYQSFASAEAQLRSIRAFAFDVLGDIQKTVEGGNELSVRQNTLMRLVVNHVTSTAADIVAFAFRYSGGFGTRAGEMQRCYRDLQTGAQHATAAPAVLGECGKDLAGFAGDKTWKYRTLE